MSGQERWASHAGEVGVVRVAPPRTDVPNPVLHHSEVDEEEESREEDECGAGWSHVDDGDGRGGGSQTSAFPLTARLGAHPEPEQDFWIADSSA